MKSTLLAVAVLLFALTSCKKDDGDNNQTPNADASASLDMRYSVDGTMTDHAGGFTGLYPFEIALNKTGTAQGTMVPKELGIPGHLILSGSSKSYYSQFGLVITFDLTTNKIASITNHYGQPSPQGRSARLDPSGINAWDPATKSVKIKYWMDDSTLTIPHRASFDETWTYLGTK